MKKSLFIFRQDLRTTDNRWLIKAINESDEILPIFIIDKNLVENFWWLDDKKFGFLREALDKLSTNITKLSNDNLKVFFDFPEDIVPYLVKKYQINKVFLLGLTIILLKQITIQFLQTFIQFKN